MPKNRANDYELTAVPFDQRKTFLGVTMVWTGFVFVIASMVAGGGLAAGLTFKEIVWVTILGNCFNSGCFPDLCNILQDGVDFCPHNEIQLWHKRFQNSFIFCTYC